MTSSSDPVASAEFNPAERSHDRGRPTLLALDLATLTGWALRTADGQILSAESTSLTSVPIDEPVAGQIRLLSPIPDLASTEVFVGRGFAALTTG